MTKRQDRTCGKLLQPLDTVTDVYDLIAGRLGNGPDSQPYPARPDLLPGRVLLPRALVRNQRILPAIHWRMNERWFLSPHAEPAPLCSPSASHFSKLWTCCSGAAASALCPPNGIFPAKQSRMKSLWVRVLGPGPEALCRESDSQAL